MGDLREPNGVVLEESSSSSSSSLSLAAAACLGPEVWARAEAATQDIIRQVQPTVVSEERRRDVVDYVQRLFRGFLGCEVFPFGSVPLKTYLPDGDIDLTAFCGFNFEEVFANDVFSVLEAEDHNPAAEFVVKDVHYIRAEVKLVKCLVQNIVVDISFNQIGGLCALCFLEEVDRLIGKDHLFKRSIILIKAWCYYESRILGAHHGLISTYALETLVLYIFHLFHSSLNGPFAVLHKFLDYFSRFDWENFGVSLSGPVHVASLPELVAGRPETSEGDLLLSDDFMRECVKKFSVPSRGPETNYRTFVQKHLNIVDPLRENNNLGRSVSQGNFFRIRSAFSYGARKLGQILVQPQEHIAEEVCKFFSNTLDRHGKGQRPDVQDLMLSSCNGFSSEMLHPVAGLCEAESYACEEDYVNPNNQSSEDRLAVEDPRHVVVSDFRKPGTYLEGTRSEHRKGVRKSSTTALSVGESSNDELSTSASCLSEDANDLATNGIRDLGITEHSDGIYPLVAEKRKSPSPHLRLSQPFENGKIENGDIYEQHRDPSFTQCEMAAQHIHEKGNSFMSWEQDNSHSCNNHDLLTSEESSHDSSMSSDVQGLQDSHSNHSSSRLGGTAGRHETVNLPDLSGDFRCHLDNLQFGRWWYDNGLTMHTQHVQLAPPPIFQTTPQWDAIRQPVQFRQDMVPQMSVNGVVPRAAFFPTNPPVAHYNVDEFPKGRGTGPYFPIMNHYSHKDRSSPKGRYHGQLKSPRTNGRGPTPLDRSTQAQPFGRQGVGKPKIPESHESSPRVKVCKEANGYVHGSEKAAEHGSPTHPPPEAALQERESCMPLDSDPSPGSLNGESVFVVNDGRLTVQSYRLKDNDDFPPLSA